MAETARRPATLRRRVARLRERIAELQEEQLAATAQLREAEAAARFRREARESERLLNLGARLYWGMVRRNDGNHAAAYRRARCIPSVGMRALRLYERELYEHDVERERRGLENEGVGWLAHTIALGDSRLECQAARILWTMRNEPGGLMGPHVDASWRPYFPYADMRSDGWEDNYGDNAVIKPGETLIVERP